MGCKTEGDHGYMYIATVLILPYMKHYDLIVLEPHHKFTTLPYSYSYPVCLSRDISVLNLAKQIKQYVHHLLHITCCIHVCTPPN